jgi:cyclin L
MSYSQLHITYSNISNYLHNPLDPKTTSRYVYRHARIFVVVDFLSHIHTIKTQATAIFLASKVEEHPRKIRDCLNAYRHLKGFSTSISDYNYVESKASFVAKEQKLLRVIAFDCEVRKPYLQLFLVANHFDCDPSVVRLAIALLNDSALLSLDSSTKPIVHAAVCLHVSSQLLSKPISSSSWWEYFNMTTVEMRNASAKLSVIMM